MKNRSFPLFRRMASLTMSAVWLYTSAAVAAPGGGGAATGGAATGGAATGGSVGGGHGVTSGGSRGMGGGFSSGSVGGGMRSGVTGLGGGSSLSAGQHLGSGAGFARSPGPAAVGSVSAGRLSSANRPTAPVNTLPAIRSRPTNAWTDPRVATRPAARAGRYGYSGGAYDAGQSYLSGRLSPGQHLYPGASDYSALSNARDRGYRGDGDRRGPLDGRFHHHRYSPYHYTGLYYPYFYGGYFPGYYGGYYDGGIGTDLTVGPNAWTDPVQAEVSAGSNVYGGGDEQDRRTDEGQASSSDTTEPASSENPAAREQSRPSAETGPDSLVEAVQDELARRGYLAGKVDGIYGEPTKAALRRFQTDRQLKVTGRINEATLHALQLD